MLIYVLGGTKGIGQAIVNRLQDDTYNVLTFSRHTEHPLDLAEDNVVEKLDHYFYAFGVPDWLVISAGRGAYIRADKLTAEEMDGLYKTNQRGPMLCSNETMLAMRRAKKGGRILLIGSTVAEYGANALEAYASTKAALRGYTKSAARHPSAKNIGIMLLEPGWTDTEMTDQIHPKLKEAIIKNIPMGRMIEAEEIAHVACDMLKWPIAAAGTIVQIAGGM